MVLAFDRKRVDGHVEPGLEGDHLGPHALHVEGQGTGGRPELQHALAGQVHAAEVVGLVTPQVPDARAGPCRRGARRRGTRRSRVRSAPSRRFDSAA